MFETIAGWGRLLGLGHRADEERRLWGRIACDLATTVTPAAQDGRELPARVKNISAGGASLTVGQAFEPGALLGVALPLQGGAELLACVVRCEPGEGGYELGCTFAAQLSDEDLQAFGARRERSAASDLRAWVRYPCHATAAYRVVRSGAAGGAVVLNISASGVALECGESLHVGELLELDLGRDGAVVLTTLASVVRTATAPDGSHIVGCNFICELSDEQVAGLI